MGPEHRLPLRLLGGRYTAKFEHENESCPVLNDMGTRRDPEVTGGDIGERKNEASRPDPDQGLRRSQS